MESELEEIRANGLQIGEEEDTTEYTVKVSDDASNYLDQICLI